MEFLYITFITLCFLKVLGDLWLVDMKEASKKWIEVNPKCDKPCARFSHSSVVSGNHIIITGGLDVDCKPLSDIWSFNIISKTWLKVDIVGLLPRYGHTAHIYEENMILVGGVNCDSAYQPGICIVSIKSLKCTEYRLPVSKTFINF